MHTTNLRKVGGSIMLTMPPAFLDAPFLLMRLIELAHQQH
jgi:hypothetical protein